MVFKETKIKNIKITDAKLCVENAAHHPSYFKHPTSRSTSSIIKAANVKPLYKMVGGKRAT